MRSPEDATAFLEAPRRKGTAWLVRRDRLLTAAHCVGNRETRTVFDPPYTATFSWGKIVVDEAPEVDFDLDVALLRIDASLVPSHIRPLRLGRIPPARQPEVEEGDVHWSAYGFPVAHTEGLHPSGKVLSLYGSVEGAPALELRCDIGGSSHLEGLSGAAILWDGVAVGILRFGARALEQRVIHATGMDQIMGVFPEVREVLEKGPWRRQLFHWNQMAPPATPRLLVRHRLEPGLALEALDGVLKGVREKGVAIPGAELEGHCAAARPAFFSPLLDCHRAALLITKPVDAFLSSLAREIDVFRARTCAESEAGPKGFRLEAVALEGLDSVEEELILRRCGLPAGQAIPSFALPAEAAQLEEYLRGLFSGHGSWAGALTPFQRVYADVLHDLAALSPDRLDIALAKLDPDLTGTPVALRRDLLASELLFRKLKELDDVFLQLPGFELRAFGEKLLDLLATEWIELEAAAGMILAGARPSPRPTVHLAWSRRHTVEMAFQRTRTCLAGAKRFQVLEFTGEGGLESLATSKRELVSNLRDLYQLDDPVADPGELGPEDVEVLEEEIELDGPVYVWSPSGVPAADLQELRRAFPFLVFLNNQEPADPTGAIRLPQVPVAGDERSRDREYKRFLRNLQNP